MIREMVGVGMPSNIRSRFIELSNITYGASARQRHKAYQLLHEIANQGGLEFYEVRQLFIRLAGYQKEHELIDRGWKTLFRNARSRLDQWKAQL